MSSHKKRLELIEEIYELKEKLAKSEKECDNLRKSLEEKDEFLQDRISSGKDSDADDPHVKSIISFIQNSPDRIIILDKEFNIVEINKPYLEMAGKEYAEVIGKNIESFIPNFKTTLRYDELVTTLDSNEVFHIIDEVPCGDNIYEYDYVMAFPIDDGLGIISRDITSQIESQKDTRRKDERLSRLEKMEALGNLAGGVAHQLNNLLVGIVSYPDLMLLSVEENDPLKKYINSIKDAGMKASKTVDELQTLARKGNIEKTRVNLNDEITRFSNREIFKDLKSRMPSISVHFDLVQEIPDFTANLKMIEHSIASLIENAMESSATNVWVTTEQKSFDEPEYRYEKINKGKYLVLTVKDDGIPMTESDIRKIFEPFYAKKYLGRHNSGLGLSIVWATAKDHNGYVDVESASGLGNSFSIYFELENGKKRKPQKVGTNIGNGEKILVVDDIRQQRDVATDLLTKLGYEVITVPSGEVALDYLDNNDVDLVMLDMIMDPGMDGLETYRRMREMKPDQKTIIVTGFAENNIVLEAQKLGAGRCIKKPYALDELIDAVRDSLEEN